MSTREGLVKREGVTVLVKITLVMIHIVISLLVFVKYIFNPIKIFLELFLPCVLQMGCQANGEAIINAFIGPRKLCVQPHPKI